MLPKDFLRINIRRYSGQRNKKVDKKMLKKEKYKIQSKRKIRKIQINCFNNKYIKKKMI